MAKPRESPTNAGFAGFTSPKSRNQVGVAVLWPLATVAGVESLYICMQSRYQVGISFLWPLATVAGAETMYIYKLNLLLVWSVWAPKHDPKHDSRAHQNDHSFFYSTTWWNMMSGGIWTRSAPAACCANCGVDGVGVSLKMCKSCMLVKIATPHAKGSIGRPIKYKIECKR